MRKKKEEEFAKAKEKKLKTVLIFEDDNKPLDNFDKRWNTIKTWLDNNLEKWEVFNDYWKANKINPFGYEDLSMFDDIQIIKNINPFQEIFFGKLATKTRGKALFIIFWLIQLGYCSRILLPYDSKP